MAVYDRWHKTARPGDKPCKCGTGKNPLYPSSVHRQGDRWQVRWRDPDTGKQLKRNFRLREGKNPDLHADAYDKKIARDVDTGDYIDPARADITLAAYADDWRKTRKTDPETARARERRLRLHVYEDPQRHGSGRTPKGGIAIGQRRLAELARRPSLISAWVAAIPLAEGSARLVVGDVSAVFTAAMDDGIVGRDPTRAQSVDWPGRGARKARPWSREQVEAMTAALPARYQVIPVLGSGTGMRQGEIFGLGTGDLQFLGRDPQISVSRQLKYISGTGLVFAPLKNRKPHTVPLAETVALRLSAHLARFPAVKVTLPWFDPQDAKRHGRPVTVHLVVTREDQRPVERNSFNANVWHAAQERAGITPPRAAGEGRAAAPEDGMHALRHTAASAWLSAGVDIVRVASWLGDTPQVVWQTYAHLMPGDTSDAGRAAVERFLSAPPCAPDVPSEVAE